MQAWTQGDPLRTRTPVIRGADHLRTSLVPSLLAARRTNESLSNPVIELFEIAKIYLPDQGLPEEWWMLGITSGRPYAEVRSRGGDRGGGSVRSWDRLQTCPTKMPICRWWIRTPHAG